MPSPSTSPRTSTSTAPRPSLMLTALAALALLGGGTALGWYLASHGKLNPPPAAAQVPAAPAHAAPASAKAPEAAILTAPAGGFDPHFVKTAVATLDKVPDQVTLSGKLAFDAEHLHLVSSRVAGRLDQILVFEGARVGRGQVLAQLYSPDWISAQHEYLLARNTLRTFESAKTAELVEDARATLASARNRMAVLGAAEEDILRLERTGVVSDHLALRAPIAGVVTKRNMDPGAFLNVGDNFMTISDVSQVWFVGNVYEQDYARIKLGQTLDLEAPALPGRRFKGVVNFIGTNIDPATHTLSIRCAVANPDGMLKPELFVNAKLTIGMREAVVVPKAAVVAVKQQQFVILEVEPGKYRRQPVSAELLVDGRSAVLSGLEGGEEVVAEGATLVNEAFGAR